MSEWKKSKTSRDFALFTFYDYYKLDCSLQKSSNMVPHIWLGIDDPEGEPLTKGFVGKRMCIGRRLAGKLALKLAQFAETGEI